MSHLFPADLFNEVRQTDYPHARSVCSTFIHVVLEDLPDLLPESGTIVDVGCGNGFILWWLKSLGRKRVGIDIDPQAVSNASQFGEAILTDFEDWTAPKDTSMVYAYYPFDYWKTKRFVDWAYKNTPYVVYLGPAGVAFVLDERWETAHFCKIFFQVQALQAGNVSHVFNRSMYITRRRDDNSNGGDPLLTRLAKAGRTFPSDIALPSTRMDKAEPCKVLSCV